jgi:hypothetical protein
MEQARRGEQPVAEWRNIMKRLCRELITPSWRRRHLSSADPLRHARIVTDPEKLAYLTAEVEKRRANSKANEDAASRRERMALLS